MARRIASPESEEQRLKRLFDDSEQRYADFVDAQTKELAFSLDSDHYQDDPGNQKQPGRVKPKGRQTFGLIRHKAGQYVRAPLHLSVIPSDYQAGAELATACKGLLTDLMADPQVRLDLVREACAIGALSARQWAYRWEYDVESDAILAALADGRGIRWAAGYLTPHDPRCPWFYEKVRMDVEEVQSMRNWDNTDDLRGDEGEATVSHSNLPAGEVDLSPPVSPALRPSGVRRYCTVVFLYERKRKSEQRIERPGTFDELPHTDRRMVCMMADGSGCGYRSQTAGQLRDEGALSSDENLPESIPSGCPDCGGDLERTDYGIKEIVRRSNRAFTVFAPNEPGGTRIFVKPRPWPHDTRSVPYVVYTCYVHPAKVMGPSETSINWTYQLGANMIDRIGLEHMLLARPYMQIPLSAVDYKGERWEFGEAQGLGIFTDPFAPGGSVNVLQAPGLPPAWATLRNAFDGALRQDLGSTDYALPPDSSRDIPVGTMEIRQQEGEVPILAQTSRWQFEDGIGLACAYDIMRAVYTDERIVQIEGRDGARYAHMLRASELPDMKITISTDPDALRMSREQINAIVSIMSQPPPLRRLLARQAGIPYEQLQQYEQDEQEWAARQQPPGPQQAPGAVMPPGIQQRLGMATNGTPPLGMPSMQ